MSFSVKSKSALYLNTCVIITSIIPFLAHSGPMTVKQAETSSTVNIVPRAISNTHYPKHLPRRMIVTFEPRYESNMINEFVIPKVLTQKPFSLTFVQHMLSQSKYVFSTFVEGDDWVKVLNAVNSLPQVAMVEEDVLFQPQYLPESLETDLFRLENDGSEKSQLSVQSMIQRYQGKARFDLLSGVNWEKVSQANVVVASLDSGYASHVSMDQNIFYELGYDFVSDHRLALDGDGRDSLALDEGNQDLEALCQQGVRPVSTWHGASVSAMISDPSHVGIDVSGLPFHPKLLPIRVLGQCGGYLSDIADAIVWASGGLVPGVPSNSLPAQVINLSLSSDGSCSPTLQSAINIARDRRASIVAAAGLDVSMPASCDGVIGVSSLTQVSQLNPRRDNNRLDELGIDLLVSVNNSAAGFNQALKGEPSTKNNALNKNRSAQPKIQTQEDKPFQLPTSLAVAKASRVAALLYDIRADITSDLVESLLVSSASRLHDCKQCENLGLLNASATIANVLDPVMLNDVDTSQEQSFVVESYDGGVDSFELYSLQVPENTKRVHLKMYGGAGDADLYVRYNSPPTLLDYNCRPLVNGNVEYCGFDNPQAGKWYIGVQGHRAFANVSVMMTIEQE